jgi:hypothetical protein
MSTMCFEQLLHCCSYSILHCQPRFEEASVHSAVITAWMRTAVLQCVVITVAMLARQTLVEAADAVKQCLSTLADRSLKLP